MNEELEILVDWLFDNLDDGWYGQVGGAKANKIGLFWLPGRAKQTVQQIQTRLPRCSLWGCTQAAYEQPFQPAGDQTGKICWLGLDVDQHDNPDTPQIELVERIADLIPQASIRTSTGGQGLHVILRLADCLTAHNSILNDLVRLAAKPYKDLLEQTGIKVCKADKRMFWLVGGANRWIKQTDATIEVETVRVDAVVTRPTPTLDDAILPSVRAWVEWFQQRGVLPANPGTSNLVYVGRVVELLRSRGFQIRTKSTCRSNNQPNGFVDIALDRISLWTYADGHNIWSWRDADDFLEGFNR